jgi:predicted nucleotidyltransferase
MIIPPPIIRLQHKLRELYGERLRGVILYGSYARGTQTQQSDIDVAVVLDGDVKPGLEIDRMIDVVTDLNLEYDTLISVYPVSASDYHSRRSPLLINLRREGIAA